MDSTVQGVSIMSYTPEPSHSEELVDLQKRCKRLQEERDKFKNSLWALRKEFAASQTQVEALELEKEELKEELEIKRRSLANLSVKRDAAEVPPSLVQLNGSDDNPIDASKLVAQKPKERQPVASGSKPPVPQAKPDIVPQTTSYSGSFRTRSFPQPTPLTTPEQAPPRVTLIPVSRSSKVKAELSKLARAKPPRKSGSRPSARNTKPDASPQIAVSASQASTSGRSAVVPQITMSASQVSTPGSSDITIRIPVPSNKSSTPGSSGAATLQTQTAVPSGQSSTPGSRSAIRKKAIESQGPIAATTSSSSSSSRSKKRSNGDGPAAGPSKRKKRGPQPEEASQTSLSTMREFVSLPESARSSVRAQFDTMISGTASRHVSESLDPQLGAYFFPLDLVHPKQNFSQSPHPPHTTADGLNGGGIALRYRSMSPVQPPTLQHGPMSDIVPSHTSATQPLQPTPAPPRPTTVSLFNDFARLLSSYDHSIPHHTPSNYFVANEDPLRNANLPAANSQPPPIENILPNLYTSLMHPNSHPVSRQTSVGDFESNGNYDLEYPEDDDVRMAVDSDPITIQEPEQGLASQMVSRRSSPVLEDAANPKQEEDEADELVPLQQDGQVEEEKMASLSVSRTPSPIPAVAREDEMISEPVPVRDQSHTPSLAPAKTGDSTPNVTSSSLKASSSVSRLPSPVVETPPEEKTIEPASLQEQPSPSGSRRPSPVGQTISEDHDEPAAPLQAEDEPSANHDANKAHVESQPKSIQDEPMEVDPKSPTVETNLDSNIHDNHPQADMEPTEESKLDSKVVEDKNAVDEQPPQVAESQQNAPTVESNLDSNIGDGQPPPQPNLDSKAVEDENAADEQLPRVAETQQNAPTVESKLDSNIEDGQPPPPPPTELQPNVDDVPAASTAEPQAEVVPVPSPGLKPDVIPCFTYTPTPESESEQAQSISTASKPKRSTPKAKAPSPASPQKTSQTRSSTASSSTTTRSGKKLDATATAASNSNALPPPPPSTSTSKRSPRATTQWDPVTGKRIQVGQTSSSSSPSQTKLTIKVSPAGKRKRSSGSRS